MVKVVDLVKNELKLVIDSISRAEARISDEFDRAVDLIINSDGKVVVTGLGKTGLIGRKISATLASTGTTSTFLHAAEGIHGDLGILDKRDVVLALSYSGNTHELITIIPYIKLLQIPIIAITGNLNSQLAKTADIVLDCSVPKGYEPFDLVPTVSTTLALALGDALAVALIKKRGFLIQDFARFHPGGTIGKKMLLTVGDLMHSANQNPVVNEKQGMRDVLLIMTQKGLGCTNVVNEAGKLTGIITDGDLRRMMSREGNFLELTASEVMTPQPKSTSVTTLAVEALNLMEEKKITMLPVTDTNNTPIGLIHMHDLINAGVVG